MATAGGHLELLQCARANGCPWDAETSRRASFRGHIKVLRWALTNCNPWSTSVGIEV